MTSASDVRRAGKLGGDGPNVWALLNEITSMLGSVKTSFWPIFENTGSLITGLGAATSLVSSDAGGAVALEDEFTPRVMRSGINYVLRNPGNTDNHFSAGDNAAYSFTDDSDDDDPFSMGVWLSPVAVSSIQALFAKYVAATEEYALRITAAGKLALELHDVSASASEIATSTLSVDPNVLRLYVVTYDGDEDAPVIKFYKDGLHDGGDGASAETGSYVGMENTATPLLLAASGLTAAPTEEYLGWWALPWMTAKELTEDEVKRFYDLSRVLVGA